MIEHSIAMSMRFLHQRFGRKILIKQYSCAPPTRCPHLTQQVETVDALHSYIKNYAGIVARDRIGEQGRASRIGAHIVLL